MHAAGYVAGKNASLHHAVNGSGAVAPARLWKVCMAIMSSCEYLDNGARRIYRLNNGTQVKERPALPGKYRFEFYDARGNRVYKPSIQREMRQAIEHHKKLWGLP
ncbi:hypothetical protein [Candidatus Symbiopectobacterium endolongispinus]|uniref:hypothetical protein n=1 Tax=Candidatus Symbiopectobacterium endolongispinus TaxID=2812664 RepID=UPI00207936F5|nr:hypothetical protein [Candidatus Symbiopectobacterium endolongispinus]